MSGLLTGFVVTRMAIGVASWFAPSLTARIFGLEPARQPIVSQLFGAREFALGLGTAVSSGDVRRQALRVGVAIDVADAVASLRGIRGFSARARILVAAGAASFAAIGVVAVAQEGNSEPSAGDAGVMAAGGTPPA